MAEITIQGYNLLGQYIRDTWSFIQLEDQNGHSITRISSQDSRLTVNYQESPRRVKLELYIKGSNNDIPIPSTLRYVSIYNVATGGVPLARDEFNPPLAITSNMDNIHIDTLIEIPRMVF